MSITDDLLESMRAQQSVVNAAIKSGADIEAQKYRGVIQDLIAGGKCALTALTSYGETCHSLECAIQRAEKL